MTPDLTALQRRLDSDPDDRAAVQALARGLAQTGDHAAAFLLLHDRGMARGDPVGLEMDERLAAAQRPILAELAGDCWGFAMTDSPLTDGAWCMHHETLKGPPVLGLWIGTSARDPALEAALQLPGLRHLRLDSRAITAEGYARLRFCQTLRGLDISGTSNRRAQLEAIASLEGLERLELGGGMERLDEGLEGLSHLRKLRHLNLGDARVGDRGVAAIAELSALQHLSLARCREIGAAGFDALIHLERLKHLNVSATAFDDDSLAVCAALPALEELLLFGTEVSAEGLLQLAASSKNLRRLVLDGALSEHGLVQEALPEVAISWLL